MYVKKLQKFLRVRNVGLVLILLLGLIFILAPQQASAASTCETYGMTDSSGICQVSDCYQLKAWGESPDLASMSRSYKVTNTLHCPGDDSLTPIGTENLPFTGSFDGDNNTIEYMVIANGSDDNVGLFGYAEGATILDINFFHANLTMEASSNVGILVGTATSGTSIKNVHTNTGSYVSASSNVGGLVGLLKDGSTISYSSVTASSINASVDYVGGLVGKVEGDNNTKVSRSWTSSDVDVAGNAFVGGLIGMLENARAEDSYADADAIATASPGNPIYLGGLVGKTKSATLNRTYSAGTVTGNMYLMGGLVGETENTTIQHSFASVANSGGGIFGEDANSILPTLANNYYDATKTSNTCSQASAGTEDNCGPAPNFDASYWLDQTKQPMASWDLFFTWNIEPDSGSFPTLFAEGEHGTAEWGGGDGSQNNPYQISDCYQLWQMRDDLAASYRLTDDVYCTNIDNFEPVGSSSSAFSGTFDGSGYTVHDLTSDYDQDNVGLFGYVNDAVLKNVNTFNFILDGWDNIGPLAGSIKGDTIVNNVHSEQTAAWGYGRAGGVIGHAYDNSSITYVSASYANISGSGGGYGGIVGMIEGNSDKVSVSRSFAATEVYIQAGNDAVGGLVGSSGYADIRNSYANTDITDGFGGAAGGLVGFMWNTDISTSYSAGEMHISTPATAGGLVGSLFYADTNTINDSFASMAGNYTGGLFGSTTQWPLSHINNNYFDTDAADNLVCFVGDDGPEPGCGEAAGGAGETEYWLDQDFEPIDGWESFTTWNFEPDSGNYPTLFGYRQFKHVDFDIGNGSIGNPYIVSSCQQLQNISLELDKWYVINPGISNIDCSETANWFDGKGFQPIGDNTAPFNGKFIGNEKSISNLHIDRVNDLPGEQEGDERFVGLFGYLHGVEMGDISLVNAKVRGYMYVGGFAGVLDSSFLGNVHVNDGVEPNECGDEGHCVWARFGNYGGGVVGYVTDSLFTDSSSGGSVKGSGVTIGGVVGTAIEESRLERLTSNAHVDGGTDIGGIVGRLESSELEDSDATGDILVQTDDMKTGDSGGGLVGSAIDSSITGSSASGSVDGKDNLGGLIGYSDGSTVSDSEASGGVIDGHSQVGGFIGFTANTAFDSNTSDVGVVSSTSENAGGFAGQAYCNSVFSADSSTAFVDASSNVGGFVGMDGCPDGPSASYSNVSATGEVWGTSNVAGLVGKAEKSTIVQSKARGNVHGSFNTGGLVALAIGSGRDSEDENLLIAESYATGNVGGAGAWAGGLVGLLENGVVVDSYARGNVTDTASAGGLIGFATADSGTYSSYSTGVVQSNDMNPGGLVGGFNEGALVSSSYWDTTDNPDVVDNGLGMGKSSVDLKVEDTFVDWDFVDTWGFDTDGDGYACLQWSDFCTSGDGDHPDLTDTDGDGVEDTVEEAGPNGGDANNDGIPDVEQANATAFINEITGKYMVVETACEANFNIQNGGESADHKDAGFDYPTGLVAFVGTDCGAPGSTVDVALYYYGNFDPVKLVLRKWADSAYSSISGAVLSSITIDNQPVLKAAYRVVDGGELDQDHVADSNIVDPVGLGQSVVGAPNTGLQLGFQ